MQRVDTPLRRILEDEGRTQTWLARRVGVSKNTVGMYVHGLWTPSREIQARVAEALGRDVHDLWPEPSQSEREAA